MPTWFASSVMSASSVLGQSNRIELQPAARVGLQLYGIALARPADSSPPLK